MHMAPGGLSAHLFRPLSIYKLRRHGLWIALGPQRLAVVRLRRGIVAGSFPHLHARRVEHQATEVAQTPQQGLASCNSRYTSVDLHLERKAWCMPAKITCARAAQLTGAYWPGRVK